MSTRKTYAQVTPANRSTVDYPGMCARFQWKALGAQNGWGFGSAREAWNGQANKHPGERPPVGVDVPIWLSWDIDPNWHAAVSLADGSVMTSPVNSLPNTQRQDRFPSIEGMIRAFPGQMRYLGWAESMDGTRVVTPAAKPAPPQDESEEDEEEDMSRPTTIVKNTKGDEVEVTTFWPDGSERVFQSTNTPQGQSYNRNVALAYGCAPQMPIIYITASHYDKIKSENAAERKARA